MSGQILVFRQDGLGARLRNTVLGLRMQALFGCDLHILWPLSRNTRELRRPQRLFGADFVSKHLVLGQDRIDGLRQGASDLSAFDSVSAVADHLSAGGSVEVRDIGSRSALPGEDPEAAHRDFMAAATRVPVHPAIRRRLDTFDQFAGGRPVTALHVRRGDIIFDPYWARRFWPTKYVPDEYYDVMIEAEPDARYLLFSDTSEAVDRFHRRHGIESAARLLGLDQVHQGQADLCELLAIARCRSVVCGSYSAFSTAATMIGGADKTALPDDMPGALRIEAESRLEARVGLGASAFINDNDFGQSVHWVANALRDRTEQAALRDLLDQTVRDGVWIPHLSGETLGDALDADADDIVLKLIDVDQAHQVFPLSYLRKPPEIKRKTHQLFAAALALCGSGAEAEAVRTMTCLVLLQQKPGPVDVLSLRLAGPLAQGACGCPPTTLVPYGPEQPGPGGFQHLSDQRDHILARFLNGQPALNWQAAMMLDWSDLSMAGGFAPRPAALRSIMAAGAAGSVMERSLAAVCSLMSGRLTSNARLIDGCTDPGGALSDTEAALLGKRRAQIHLAQGQHDDAAKEMDAVLALSDHPAFAVWWAIQLDRAGHRAPALDLLARVEPATQAALFQLLSLTPEDRDPPGITRAELRDRIEAGFRPDSSRSASSAA